MVNSRLVFRLVTALVATILLPSCASRMFYDSVDGTGRITGRPSIDWVQPNKFVYNQDKNEGFAFVRPNGEVIVPETIETDGGSIPRILWNKKGFTPWTYAPAYLVHDWLYEAHRRGEPGGIMRDGTPVHYTKEQADWIMAEVIKSQMENLELFATERSPGQLKRIHTAVNHFGKTAWRDEPRLVSDALLEPINDVIDFLPLRDWLEALQDELVPAPAPPPMSGTVTRQL